MGGNGERRHAGQLGNAGRSPNFVPPFFKSPPPYSEVSGISESVSETMEGRLSLAYISWK
jgi:hypothetical protein